MPLETREIPVLAHIPEPGDEYIVKGTLPGDSYQVGGETYELPRGVDYDLVFTNTGGAILLTGMARATAVGVCSRCLEPAELHLAGEVEGFYLTSDDPQAPAGDDDPGEDEFEQLGDDGVIDISEPIHATLVLETPVMPLCREDCRGLCPVCGHNLNEGDCEHVGQAPDDGADNPFAVLKNLKFDD